MSGSTSASSSGQGGYLLPAGYLSTSGSQIIDANGNPVRIDSIGWSGTDGAAGSALNGLYAESYQTMLNALKADGFNTVRIPWSDVDLMAMPNANSIDYSQNPDLQGLNTLQIFQKIVAYAGQIGVKIIFDHHTNDGGPGGWGGQQANGLWFDSGPGSDGTDGSGTTGTVTAAQFQQDWVTLASTFKGNATVIGYDLDNEPTSAGNINWGQGGSTDIQAMYTTVGNAVEAADPGALIIAEGPQEYNPPSTGSGMSTSVAAPDGDLTGVAADPVVLNTPNKVVYSVHEYPSYVSGVTIDSGAAKVQQMNQDWGYLVSQNIAPVWIGEMGANFDGTYGGENVADSQAWASTLLGYMNGQDGAQGGPTFTGNQQGVGGDWWAAGANTGSQLDGIQSAWGAGNYRPAQQAETNQMLFVPKQTPAPTPTPTPKPTPVPTPTPTPTSSVTDTVVKAGSTAAIVDAAGNSWTITASGQVAVNGTIDTLTGGVVELAYVNGTIWQQNTSKLWWGKTSSNTAWTPPTGTSISPLPAASVSNTVITAGSPTAILDASGNSWAVTSGGQVAVNGTVDTTTANVSKLAYVNGTIWQQNASALWWSKTTPAASWAPPTGTTVSPLTASANDTTVTAGSSAAIVDTGGNSWTITSSGQVAVNGVVDASTASVSELAYVNGTVWQENTSKLWWGKTSPTASWSPPTGTAVSPLPPAPSANDTVVAVGSTAALIDASTNSWTITSGGQVAVNGSVDATTGNVIKLAYVNGTIWQENASMLWWGKTSPTAAWAPGTGTSVNPLPTSTITISQSQASETVSQSHVSIVSASGNHAVFISGSADTATLAGGTNTITDTGSGNTYVLPAAGQGYDTFAGNILNIAGDMLDLQPALAATGWNGQASTLAQYLSVADSSQGAVLAIAPTAGAAAVAVASINGATTASLSTLLTHAIT